MQNLLQPETFEFFARYLLAGYIFLSVRSRLVAGQRAGPSEIVLEAVVLSLINQLVFQLLLSLSLIIPLNIRVPIGTAVPAQLWFYAEVLCLPALLGWAFAKATGLRQVSAVLRKLSMPGTHPVARAYDFAFLQQSGPGYVILTFQDDTVIYGYYGNNSIAATDADRSDIYLESLYTLEGGAWQLAEPRRSALISLAGLRSIEFVQEDADAA